MTEMIASLARIEVLLQQHGKLLTEIMAALTTTNNPAVLPHRRCR